MFDIKSKQTLLAMLSNDTINVSSCTAMCKIKQLYIFFFNIFCRVYVKQNTHTHTHTHTHTQTYTHQNYTIFRKTKPIIIIANRVVRTAIVIKTVYLTVKSNNSFCVLSILCIIIYNGLLNKYKHRIFNTKSNPAVIYTPFKFFLFVVFFF